MHLKKMQRSQLPFCRSRFNRVGAADHDKKLTGSLSSRIRHLPNAKSARDDLHSSQKIALSGRLPTVFDEPNPYLCNSDLIRNSAAMISLPALNPKS